jgi:hypothetical protein
MYRSLISLKPNTPPLLYDLYPNASVAYSLRKLRNAYSGSAIRVRRSVDNTEQDFGFDEINDTLTDWVGYNLWTYSEQMQQFVWAKTNITSTTDTIVAPDGNTTGDVILETIANSTHSLNRGQVVLAGDEYTISFWVKPEGRNFVSVRCAINLSTNNISQPVAFFDLTTGTKISDNGLFRVAPIITAVGGGWYKIEYGLIANSTTTSTALQLNLSTDGTTTTYTGDVTKGMAIWGLQLTESSTVRPYRQTLDIAEGDGRISRFFDQSGNGNDLINASSGLQYRIVVNGLIYRNSDNNLPATQVVSTGFYTFTVNNISTSNPLINFNVYKSQPGNMILFGNSVTGGRPVINLHQGVAGSRLIRTRLTSNTGGEFDIPFETNGSFITSTTRDISDNVEITVNDNLIGSYTITGGLTNNLTHLGRFSSSANASTGEMQEMIIWKQDYVSLKSNISDKINEYYGIY